MSVVRGGAGPRVGDGDGGGAERIYSVVCGSITVTCGSVGSINSRRFSNRRVGESGGRGTVFMEKRVISLFPGGSHC